LSRILTVLFKYKIIMKGKVCYYWAAGLLAAVVVAVSAINVNLALSDSVKVSLVSLETIASESSGGESCLNIINN
jgi:hypothetical protein